MDDRADLPPSESRRPFGSGADLDLDFCSSDRPSLVTALLDGCRPAPSGFWWQRTVAERTAALVDLLLLTEGRSAVDLHARCAACGETFGFELPLAGLPPPGSGPLRVAFDQGREVELRRPSGDDLRRWRASQPASRRDAVRAMLQTLCVAGDVSEADEPALAAALADADPLVDFEVDGRCPACDAATTIGVDLEALALSRFAARQREIEADLHRLAQAYGWTEGQSLAVAPSRRRRYLALIAAEADR